MVTSVQVFELSCASALFMCALAFARIDGAEGVKTFKVFGAEFFLSRPVHFNEKFCNGLHRPAV